MPKPDLLSLIIGLIIGILLVAFLSRPGFRKIIPKLSLKNLKRKKTDKNFELSLRKFLLRQAQGLHMLSYFCSLSEVYVTQKMITSPLFLRQGTDLDDIPAIFHNPLFLEEISELSQHYPLPLITLGEALSGGKNLVVKGRVGAGKTTALANLVIEILETRCINPTLNDRLPIYIHVRDLVFSESQNDFEECLVDGLCFQDRSLNQIEVLSIIRNYRDKQKLLLLIDGFDELLPDQLDTYINHIHDYNSANPTVQIVVCSGPYYTGELLHHGFVPLYIKAPDLYDRFKFIDNIFKIFPNNRDFPQSLFLNKWFKQDLENSDLFEIIVGIITNLSLRVKNTRDALAEYVSYGSTGQLDISDLINLVESASQRGEIGFSSSELEKNLREKTSSGNILPSLLEHRLLVIRNDGRYYFFNPELFCRILSRSKTNMVSFDLTQLSRAPILNRAAQLSSEINYIINWLTLIPQKADLKLTLAMTLEHYLSKSNKNIDLNSVSENIAKIIVSQEQPLTIRYLAANLLYYGQPRVFNYLLGILSNSDQPDTAALCALFIGKPGVQLAPDFSDKLFLNQKGALARVHFLLALVNHPETDLPGFIDAEMNSAMGKTTAELLALIGGKGYKRLLDYSQHENPNCRRNAVYGLRLVDETWALDALDSLNKTDNFWMVRDAAAQALENRWDQSIYAPQRIPPIVNNPEIIQFSADNNIAIPATGLPEELITKLVFSRDYRKQLLGILYLFSIPCNQSRKFLTALAHRSHPVREIAYYALREMSRDI